MYDNHLIAYWQVPDRNWPADNLSTRIVTKEPGGKGDGRAVGFERAWRNVNYQALRFTTKTGLKLRRNHFYVPVRMNGRSGVQFVKTTFDEPIESPNVASHDIHSGSVSLFFLLQGLLKPLQNVGHDLLVCLREDLVAWRTLERRRTAPQPM